MPPAKNAGGLRIATNYIAYRAELTVGCGRIPVVPWSCRDRLPGRGRGRGRGGRIPCRGRGRIPIVPCSCRDRLPGHGRGRDHGGHIPRRGRAVIAYRAVVVVAVPDRGRGHGGRGRIPRRTAPRLMLWDYMSRRRIVGLAVLSA